MRPDRMQRIAACQRAGNSLPPALPEPFEQRAEGNSIPPRIRVHAVREGDFWKLSVRHNGIGISPDHAQQIFGLFKRLHTQEEFAEAGIALALCLKIVQRYGGRIWVESEGPGKGSNFFFTVPGPNWSIAP